MVRLLRRARRRVKCEFKDHRRRAKRRMLEIQRARSAEDRQPLYRDLIKVTEKTAKAVLHAVASLQQLRTGEPSQQQEEIDHLVQAMQYYVAAARHVIDQTRRRVLQGETVPAPQKIVSIFEPIYRALRNFRAGIEGVISWLKRSFGAYSARLRQPFQRHPGTRSGAPGRDGSVATGSLRPLAPPLGAGDAWMISPILPCSSLRALSSSSSTAPSARARARCGPAGRRSRRRRWSQRASRAKFSSAPGW